MPKTTNEKIQDRITTHSVNLLRFEASERKKILKQLQELEKNISKQLMNMPPNALMDAPQRILQKRLDKLFEQTTSTIGTAYEAITDDQASMLEDLVQLESDFAEATLARSIVVEVETVGLTPAMIKKIASETLIQGAASAEWWGRQEAALVDKFKDTIRQGMYQGESIGQMVDRIRGTAARGYKDGLMEVNFRNAQNLVRSSVQTVANRAREETWSANDDLISALVVTATLDGRTTAECRARDGLMYTVDTHEPIGHSISWGAGAGSWHWC